MQEEEWRTQVAVLKSARDDAERQLEDARKKLAAYKNRSNGETPSAELVELKGYESKATSSEGTVDSNNGWEKVLAEQF